jgi:hypothetical protein
MQYLLSNKNVKYVNFQLVKFLTSQAVNTIQMGGQQLSQYDKGSSRNWTTSCKRAQMGHKSKKLIKL